jgi:hypothetical protein
MSYLIAVNFRTTTTCQTTTVEVIADSTDAAFAAASAKVRKRRRWVTVDGGTMLGDPRPLPAPPAFKAERMRHG